MICSQLVIGIQGVGKVGGPLVSRSMRTLVQNEHYGAATAKWISRLRALSLKSGLKTKKACIAASLFMPRWLPDLGSNQGPND